MLKLLAIGTIFLASCAVSAEGVLRFDLTDYPNIRIINETESAANATNGGNVTIVPEDSPINLKLKEDIKKMNQK